MKHYLGSKAKVLLLRVLQGFLFAIPMGVFLIVYRDTFFVEESGIGLAGVAVLGLIIWGLCLAKVFGKLPKILYFIILFFLFLAMSYVADFLKQIGTVVLIGAVLALPINYIINAISIDGEVDLKERSKVKAIKRMKKEKVNVEVGD